MNERRGWYSRGFLPHLDVPGRQFLTWRLADAVPDAAIDQWEAELAQEPDRERARELNRRIERYADAGHGACVLRDPRAARLMQETLFHDHRIRYDLLVWAIMPNHVHVVLEPIPPHALSGIVQALKGVSSKRIGKLRGVEGRLWQPDYFDRLLRDDRHFERVERYIEWNPVKAGLCWEPKGYAWSSANPDARKRREVVADLGSGDPERTGRPRSGGPA